LQQPSSPLSDKRHQSSKSAKTSSSHKLNVKPTEGRSSKIDIASSQKHGVKPQAEGRSSKLDVTASQKHGVKGSAEGRSSKTDVKKGITVCTCDTVISCSDMDL